MAHDVNKVTLVGTVGRDPDHETGGVSTITVRTVDEVRGNEWHVVKYGGAGREQLTRGTRVVVAGRLVYDPHGYVEAEGVVILRRAQSVDVEAITADPGVTVSVTPATDEDPHEVAERVRTRDGGAAQAFGLL